jgi:hypothetical protein
LLLAQYVSPWFNKTSSLSTCKYICTLCIKHLIKNIYNIYHLVVLALS